MLTAEIRTVARRQYVERHLLASRAVKATRVAWAQLDPAAIRSSWHAQVGPAVTRIVTGAQFQAAAAAGPGVSDALAAQNERDDPVGDLNAAAFSGTASDGRDLASLLELSNVYALQRIGLGDTVKSSLAVGGRWLSSVVATQVTDAGRVAGGVAIASRPHTDGFVRMLDPPSCSRCAILAGAWYRWNAGFARHPRCDCTEVPAGENVAGDLRTDPMEAFRAGKISDLSRAETKAVNDGGDLNQIVNAHRGMSTAGGRRYTREGTSRHGSYGGANGGIARLTPEQIYRDARGSRTEAIRLLRRYGYIS